MIKITGFRQFVKEELEKFTKLKHLEHPEDLHIEAGEHGYKHAMASLNAVHDKLKGKFNTTKVTTKYDGSPSVVFGHHPENGKFFVASKSAFNVNPKLNYTHEDIQKNHGHAPGLVHKLSSALEHLPKVTPKHGVYQGDIMHTNDDVHESAHHYNFTPNTIMYSVPKKSEEGEKVKKSKFGIVVHTKYHGNDLQKATAGFDPDLHNFKHHSDVHMISPEVKMDKALHTGKNQKDFEHHMKMAEKEHRNMSPGGYNNVRQHSQHLKTYINSTVRSNTKPTVEGYRLHLLQHGKKQMESVKTPKAKQEKFNAMESNIKHLEHHSGDFKTALKLHHHIQNAKNSLVDSLNHSSEYEHSIGGKETNPEGFVAVHEGHPIKLVNRAEFSRANFEKNRS